MTRFGVMKHLAEPWAAALSGLKNRLEKRMEKIFEIYIKTTPERLWKAITDGEMSTRRAGWSRA